MSRCTAGLSAANGGDQIFAVNMQQLDWNTPRAGKEFENDFVRAVACQLCFVCAMGGCVLSFRVCNGGMRPFVSFRTSRSIPPQMAVGNRW